MKFKINTQLLPIKFHYLLFLGGSASTLSFAPVIAKQLGINDVGVGIIFGCLPLFALLSKIIVGAISDHYQKQKLIFMILIATTLVGAFSISFIPENKHRSRTTVDFNCNIDSVLSNCGHASNCSYISLVNEFHTKGSPSGIECKLSCIIRSRFDLESLCAWWDDTYLRDQCEFYHLLPNKTRISTESDMPSNVRKRRGLLKASREIETTTKTADDDDSEIEIHAIFALNLSHVVQDHDCLFFPVKQAAVIEDFNVLTPVCYERLNIKDCRISCPGTKLVSFLHRKIEPISVDDNFTTLQFWLFFVFMIFNFAGVSVVCSVGDAICFQMLGDKPGHYGRQRAWGSVGWGVCTLLCGYLVDRASLGSDEKNYEPIFLILLALLFFDLIAVSRINISEPNKKSSNVIKDVLCLFTDVRVVFFVLWCLVVGMCTGLLWNFLFWYLQDLAAKGGCDALAWIATLQGSVAIIQCFSEIPFFFISGWIIKKINRVNSMTLVLLVFGFRFIIYSVLSDPWMVLPLEILNGVTFGVFYSVMTSYANCISHPGTTATVQGVFSAAFEGLGVACGSFFGGLLFHSYGGAMAFRLFGSSAVALAIVHLVAQLLIARCQNSSKVNGGLLSSIEYSPPADGLKIYSNNSAGIVDDYDFDDHDDVNIVKKQALLVDREML